MLRQKPASGSVGACRTSSQPLAEGISDGKRPRRWASMSDADVLAYARRFVRDEAITSRKGLARADCGLCLVLRARKLLDEVGLEDRRETRRWGKNCEVLAFARRLIVEKGIMNREGLQRADSGLHSVLKRRGLLDKLKFGKTQRKWGTDSEVLDFARRFIGKNGITSRSGLEKADRGLYCVLSERGLLDSCGLKERQGKRKWGTDASVLEAARRKIKGEGIRNRSGLQKADAGLYKVLRERSLLDEVGFRGMRETRRWGRDEDALAFVRKLIDAQGITGRFELQNADSGLYDMLRRRNLLDGAGLLKKHRDWAAMDRRKLKSFARKFISDKGIKARSELEKVDVGLYDTLKRRKMLDAVFSDIESSKQKEAVRGVIDSLESFGEERDGAGRGSDKG